MTEMITQYLQHTRKCVQDLKKQRSNGHFSSCGNKNDGAERENGN